MAEALRHKSRRASVLRCLADLADALPAGVIWLAGEVFLVAGAVVAEQDQVLTAEA